MTDIKTPTSTRAEYMDRLRDLLPYRESSRILEEVDGLLQDRMEAELEARDDATPAEAERRAMEALGTAEQLADSLVAPPIQIDFRTQRAFARLLAITFAVHLLLSIVFTVAGSTTAVIPGVLSALPLQPIGALVSAVLAIFLLDAGALFLLFALFGRGKAPPILPELSLRSMASRRDATLGLVLLALVALILHLFRDQVFAVRDGDHLVGILAPDVVNLLPFVDVILLLFAAQQISILVTRRENPVGVAADALASLGLALVLAVAATRGQLVEFPTGSLGHQAAATLSDLTTRVLMLVFVGAALFLAVRFVKRVIRLRQLIAASRAA